MNDLGCMGANGRGNWEDYNIEDMLFISILIINLLNNSHFRSNIILVGTGS